MSPRPPITGIVGVPCLLGAALAVLGTELTWFHLITAISRAGIERTYVFNENLYQLHSDRYAYPVGSGGLPIGVDAGAFALSIAGIALLVPLRRRPVHLLGVLTALAAAAVLASALLSSGTPVGPTLESVTVVTRGPGEAISLIGAGIGLAAGAAQVVSGAYFDRFRTESLPASQTSPA